MTCAVDREDGQVIAVAYDLATLTRVEVLRAQLRGKFPLTRNPIRIWLAAILFLPLSLAMFGFIVGMATWPRFQPETMAIAFGVAGTFVPVLNLSRIEVLAKRLREEGKCTTELSSEGITRRTRTRECKYIWVPHQRFHRVGKDIIISINKYDKLWLPCRAFPSSDAVESFLRAARDFHANAMNRR